MLGTAMRQNSTNISPEKSVLLWVEGIFRNLLSTTNNARIQLIPWQINVARATPYTRMPNTCTNAISITMLDKDEKARNTNGVLESPIAEKIPVARL